MQFIDQANIILKAGKGGNGIVSFRREKFGLLEDLPEGMVAEVVQLF